ncbi:MAG: PIN domain-containing protein [Thermoproteota archaeon]|nr:MAG: PIN domain-containing protein [Candidatus Korarchaeota archaeon]RLG55090.1 MAG: PIN domain-containing protein [Candidatus Korarchaeota archaeon]
MLVIDASVWFDLFNEHDKDRRRLAEQLFSEAEKLHIYEPALFKVELAGLLARRHGQEVVRKLVKEVTERVTVLNGLHEEAFEAALKTGCRAADAYYIACAKLTGAVLISNDRIQVLNARKAGVKSYYLLKQGYEVFKAIQGLREGPGYRSGL